MRPLGVRVPVVRARRGPAVQHQVLVHVDQTGRHDTALTVDFDHPLGRFDTCGNLLDLVPDDEQVETRLRAVARAVPHAHVRDENLRRLFLLCGFSRAFWAGGPSQQDGGGSAGPGQGHGAQQARRTFHSSHRFSSDPIGRFESVASKRQRPCHFAPRRGKRAR